MTGAGERWRAICGAVLAAVLWAAAAAAQSTVEQLATTGELGPLGLPLSAVLAPAEGPTRELVFLARTSGVFRRGVTGLEAEVAAGTVLPDGTVAGVGSPGLDENGCVVVVASLVGGDQALYRRCSGMITRVVGAGDVTAGGDTILRLGPDAPFATAGAVALGARLSSGVDVALRVGGGPPVEIARPGDPLPSGGVVASIRVAGLRADGSVGVLASVSGGRDGVFVGTGGPLVKALTAGDATLVGRLDTIEQATLSPAGLWAFVGELEDGRRGLFRFDGSVPLPLVVALTLVGDGVPTRPGTTIRDVPRSQVPSINAAGDVAFRATLEGTQGGAALFATRGTLVPELLFSTRDTTDVGVLARLRDPQIADDGSVLFAATPNRDGTGLYVHRAGRVTGLARFGDDTDVGLPDQRFRFTGGRVGATAEGGVLAGEHDVLTRQLGAEAPEVIATMGGPSPIGGQLAEFGSPEVDSKGRVLFRASVAGASRAEGIFVVSDRGIVDRAVSGERVKGGRLGALAQLAPELGGDLTVARRLGAVAAAIEEGSVDAGLFLIKGARPRRVERTGRTWPGIGEVVALGTRPALVARRRYAFLAAVRDGTTRDAVIARRRKRRLVAREGDDTGTRLPGRFAGFTVPDADTTAIVFRATSTTGAEGIVLDDWKTSQLILATGDAVGPGLTVGALGRPVLTAGAVHTRATLEEATLVRDALLKLPLTEDGGALDPEILLVGGDLLPGGGALLDLVSIRGTARGSILIRAGLANGGVREALLRVTPAQP